MEINKLMQELDALKRQGIKEIYFSSDEEGNNIYKQAMIQPTKITEKKVVAVAYPYGTDINNS